MKCLFILTIILAFIALIFLTTIYDVASSTPPPVGGGDRGEGATETAAAHDTHAQLTARANLEDPNP